MEKSLNYMSHEFATIRTGKASPSLVESLDVEAYGTAMKLKQLALITAPEPRLLLIQPFDVGTVRDIERAINESRIGITPAVDGKLIRIPIPELSEERRKELTRTVKQIAEESRIRIRGCRRDAMETAKKLQKEGTLTEDGLHSAEEQIQKLTNRFIEQVDKHVGVKEAELMKI